MTLADVSMAMSVATLVLVISIGHQLQQGQRRNETNLRTLGKLVMRNDK